MPILVICATRLAPGTHRISWSGASTGDAVLVDANDSPPPWRRIADIVVNSSAEGPPRERQRVIAVLAYIQRVEQALIRQMPELDAS